MVHLEVGDEGGRVEAQGPAVDRLAAPLQQQQLVEGLHTTARHTSPCSCWC